MASISDSQYNYSCKVGISEGKQLVNPRSQTLSVPLGQQHVAPPYPSGCSSAPGKKEDTLYYEL